MRKGGVYLLTPEADDNPGSSTRGHTLDAPIPNTFALEEALIYFPPTHWVQTLKRTIQKCWTNALLAFFLIWLKCDMSYFLSAPKTTGQVLC